MTKEGRPYNEEKTVSSVNGVGKLDSYMDMKEIRTLFRDFPNGPVVENPPANAEDVSSIPGL